MFRQIGLLQNSLGLMFLFEENRIACPLPQWAITLEYMLGN